MDLVCTACGAQNPQASRFCGTCGSPLTQSCPACGAALAAGQRFCNACGTPVDAGAGSAPSVHVPGQHAPVAERRVCSVLFADLVGFTPLSESRDPEEVRELLSAYFERTRTVIERYGGVVEKFIGDAVMAVWGTPVAVEGDAERAVRAGIDVAAAVALLGEQLGAAGLQARAGVVTGEIAVTVGLVGEGIAGDSVNTAARVQTAAEPGQVLVDETTFRLARAAVEFVDVGEHVLKGKAEPMRLWAATRVLSGVGGSQRVDGLEAPLLGRDAELRTIKELFHAAVERRSARLVVVSGPAGVGKSRLGWEFEKYVDGLAGAVWWHRGRCLSYGEGVAFWALAEIVRQRLGIADEDPTDVAAEKLTAGLAEHVPDPDVRGYIAVRLGRLLGVPVQSDTGTTLSREELFAGWRMFFEQLGASGPVVLLVEDAQHADPGMLEFLDYVADWSRDDPIFVLVFARSELMHARPGWGIGPNRTVLALDPLDPVSMDALVDALVPGMPAAARTSISTQTQGIPLFAVETIRSLIDRDVVVPVEGVYRLVGDVGGLEVPDSLRGLLAARLDALPADLRSLVGDAAVLGASFPAEALAAVTGSDPDAVRAALAELQRRQILEVSADRLSPQRGSYGFSHAMLRQVAYETLSRRDRKERHLAVAAHLRSTFAGDGDEVIDVIARHYQDALAAMPGDADAELIRADAIAAYMRGAERSLRSGSPRNASTSYAAAARLSEETGGSDAARLWERSAEAATIGGDAETPIEHADRAIELYRHAGDERGAARANAVAGRAYVDARMYAEAGERLHAALAVLEAEPDADTVVALRWLALREVMSAGAEAQQSTERALVLGQELGVDAPLLAELLTDRAMSLTMAGRTAEGIANYRYAAELAQQADDGVALGRAYGNLSDALLTSDPNAALEAARKGIEYNRRVGARTRYGISIANLGSALLWTGRWDEAEAELETALRSEALAGNWDVLSIVAMLAALRGDLQTATETFETIGLYLDDPQSQGYLRAAEALAAAATGPAGEALRLAQDAVDLGRSVGVYSEIVAWSWPTAARAAWVLGDDAHTEQLISYLDGYPRGQIPPLLRAERLLAAARMAPAESRAALDQAFAEPVAALRRCASPYHLASALLDHAERLIDIAEPHVADALIEEARGLAEQLTARPLLARGKLLAAGDRVQTGQT